MKLNLGFKKFYEDAVLPQYAHSETDAGLDIIAYTEPKVIRDRNGLRVQYGTGIGVQLPSDHAGLIFPRSSIKNYSLALSNSIGLIDPGYQGEIQIYFNLLNQYGNIYKKGDKIAQLLVLPFPRIEPVEISEFTPSSRGTGGFGSTDVEKQGEE